MLFDRTADEICVLAPGECRDRQSGPSPRNSARGTLITKVGEPYLC